MNGDGRIQVLFYWYDNRDTGQSSLDLTLTRSSHQYRGRVDGEDESIIPTAVGGGGGGRKRGEGWRMSSRFTVTGWQTELGRVSYQSLKPSQPLRLSQSDNWAERGEGGGR